MTRATRFVSFAVSVAMLLTFSAIGASTQGRPAHPHGPSPSPHIAARGEFIFVGGYFYDPNFGPYPWWPRTVYRGWYVPIYDYRADVRLIATPREAAVYVDGFYAGVVNDFDGIFQRLFLPPGEHTIVLYLDGYRTTYHHVYLRPGSSLKLHDGLVPLPPGVVSEPPPLESPVPPPPAGSYRAPRTPPPVVRTPAEGSESEGVGTIDLRVQPAGATVTIDGQPWVTSDAGHFVVQVSEGKHHVQASKQGYMPWSTEIEVLEDKTVPLNVSLPPD